MTAAIEVENLTKIYGPGTAQSYSPVGRRPCQLTGTPRRGVRFSRPQ